MRFWDAVAAPAAVALARHGTHWAAWWWHGADCIAAASAGIVWAAFGVWNAVAGPATVGDPCSGVGWANWWHGEAVHVASAAARIWVDWHARGAANASGITLLDANGAWGAVHPRTQRTFIRHALYVARCRAHGVARHWVAWKAAFFAV